MPCRPSLDGPLWERPGLGRARPGNTEFMSNQDSGTTPSDATKAEEEVEASAPHDADRAPTQDEEQAAPTSVSPGVAEHEEEMAELGAKVKGEGELP